MKAKAIEIRWHNTKPIYSTDFQLSPPSNLSSLIPNKSHPYLLSELDKQLKQSESEIGSGRVWRLATAGGDNLVMMWLVYPRPTFAQVNQHRDAYQSSRQPTPPALVPKSIAELKLNHPPIVEYLATLTKHQGVVNVVRFCPKGEMLASASDDGNVLLWVLSTNPMPAAFGESAADKAYERESWRTRLMLRGPAQCEIYDLAWSPCGDFLLTGDTAKTARIWNVTDGSCIKQIAEHSNFVQGVAWDPLGEYIATQSSDRTMNIYSVQICRDENGGATADVHHVAQNYKIDVFNQQANSWAKFLNHHHQKEEHHTSSARSLATSTSIDTRSDTSAPTSVTSAQTPRPKMHSRTVSTVANVSDSPSHPASQVNPSNRVVSIPQTPNSATSVAFNEDSSMQPPTEIPHHNSVSSMPTTNIRTLSSSRQSSVVSSQAMSPSSIRPIRSPSPVPPLPAIHVNEEKRSSSVLLYGDEGASAFFRRLAWSNDGSTLITPAGRWENRFSEPESVCKGNGKGKAKETERRSRRDHLPGKKNRGVHGGAIDLTTDSDEELDQTAGQGPGAKEHPTVLIYGRGTIQSSSGKMQVCQPLARLPGHKTSSIAIRFSPVIYRLKSIKSRDRGSIKAPGQLLPPVHIQLGHGSPMQEVDLNTSASHHRNQSSPKSNEESIGVFDLPYRMVYAVATHDTVYVYDTQQSSPICLFNNLHFSSFTDLSWSNDGETLVLSSSDGYCSLVIFDKDELGERLSEAEAQALLPEKLSASKKEEEDGTVVDGMNEANKNVIHRVPAVVSQRTRTEVDVAGAGSQELGTRKREVEHSSPVAHPPLPVRRAPDPSHDDCAPPPLKKKKRAPLTFEGPVKG